MSSASSKRSVMTLFSNKDDIYSHQVKIVLAEKGVAYENEEVDPKLLSEDLMESNPYGSFPKLVDRDLVLFNSNIIIGFLDERFPHPPLMSVYPIARAKSRLLMFRIEKDWYSTLESAEKGNEIESEKAIKQLKEELLAASSVFKQADYFMSDEFSLVDCYVAPLLWKLTKKFGVKFTGSGSSAIRGYMDRVFERDSFQQSVGKVAPRNLMDDK